MDFYLHRRHDARPKSIAECIIPGSAGLDMNKYQLYVAQQADRSRRRITALVGASYEEDINQNNARSGRRRGCRPGSRRDGVTNALADSSTCIDGEDSDDEDCDTKEHQVGMMNMILGHMLRK